MMKLSAPSVTRWCGYPMPFSASPSLNSDLPDTQILTHFRYNIENMADDETPTAQVANLHLDEATGEMVRYARGLEWLSSLILTPSFAVKVSWSYARKCASKPRKRLRRLPSLPATHLKPRSLLGQKSKKPRSPQRCVYWSWKSNTVHWTKSASYRASRGEDSQLKREQWLSSLPTHVL